MNEPTKAQLDEYLMHYGVKGMKWGVRKKRTDAGTSRQVARAQKKWDRKSRGRTRIEAYNNAADRMNNGLIQKFNTKHKGKSFDQTTESGRKIMAEYEDLFNKVYAEEVTKIIGKRPGS